MSIKSLLVYIGKLLICSVVFVVGLSIGGMLAAALKLTQPPMPAGAENVPLMLYMIAEVPLLALLLAGIARNLAGGFWSRLLSLAALTWIADYLNNQIEAAFFSDMGPGFAFTVLTFLFPSLAIGAAVAWLFPHQGTRENFREVVRQFFSRLGAQTWAWRLALAAVVFMPIYYFFGLLVIPFTRDYYVQGTFGLRIPALSVLLPVLLLRSILFLLACLPVVIAWRGTRRSLTLWLGACLLYLVGLQSLLIAVWMPLALRVPHTLEILADEFVYAGLLALLLRRRDIAEAHVDQPATAPKRADARP